MALQDLTPQLRTRLSRMERAVGWFVMLATALLLFGFGYYLYKTAQDKGWFKKKFEYQTSLNDGSGLKPGDPVKIMGSPAGQITEIIPNAPGDYYGITIKFKIQEPHYGYIWDDSRITVASDILGNRVLQISKGVSGVPTILDSTNKTPMAMLNWKLVREERKKVVGDLEKAKPGLEGTNYDAFNAAVKDELATRVLADSTRFYTNLTAFYWIDPTEAPSLQDRLQAVINQVETALPNILNLTNQLTTTLSTVTTLASNLNNVAVSAQPTVSNLATLTGQLNRPGALGEWLLPTNVNQKLDSVMGNADVAVGNLNTNLVTLNLSLLHLANLTSNLNEQVQVNTNILSNVSKTVVDTDNLVQGLKHHWLLRSAFKKENTNAPPEKNSRLVLPPKLQ